MRLMRNMETIIVMIDEGKVKINTERLKHFLIGFFFAMLLVVIPSIADIFPLYGWMVKGVLRPFFLIILFFYVLFRQKSFYSNDLRLLCYLIIFSVLMMITTIIGRGNILSAFIYALSILSIPLFFITVDSNSLYPTTKGISAYLHILLILYLLSVFFFHNKGMYNFGLDRKYYFWGHVNSSVKLALPSVTILGIMDTYKKGHISISTWIISFLAFFAQVYSKSYVAAMGMLIYLGILVFFSRKPLVIHYIPKWLPLAFSLFILFCCCMLSIPAAQHVMREVGTFLGRAMSVDYRFIIWRQGISSVTDNIWGYGRLSSFNQYIHIRNYYPSSAHNLYIDLAMQLGVIGLVLFICFLLRSFNLMPAWRSWIMIPAALFSYAFMWNLEPYFSEPHFTLFLILLFVCVSLNKECEHNGQTEIQ